MIHKLSGIIRILFQRVSIERLLSLSDDIKIYYDDVGTEYLKELMLTYMPQVSDTEVDLQTLEIRTQVNNDGLAFFYPDQPNELNVFSILCFYLPEVLVFHENRVACRYNQLLEWNELVRVIGQDLPVTAFLARNDIEFNKECENFCWRPVIGHNNRQLDRILEKGLADNHFHLRCSAPYFSVSWVNLMNNPGRNDFVRRLKYIEKNCRDKNKKSEVSVERQPLYKLVQKASLIRLYLCSKLERFDLLLEDIDGESIRRDDIFPYVERLLADPIQLETVITTVQSNIDILYDSGWNQDYMLRFTPGKFADGQEEYWILSGERYFLYSMMRKILSGDEMFSRRECNLFFAYLRIKNELRSELVQTNSIVGFENFQIHQGRKDMFSHMGGWISSEGTLARLAVKGALSASAVKHLELRISPGNSALENAENIRGYDEAILRAYSRDEILMETVMEVLKDGSRYSPHSEKDDLRDRFHYVFHFTKKADYLEENFEALECRHYSFRKQILQRAAEILKFRRDYPQYGRRVVGIDACSQEIGCRPEVFARIFRTLKNYVPSSQKIGYEYDLPQLKITYHVGEDFLDVSDGLRAIDEAIRFLNLDCGDRLGHALALGIDAEKWYAVKKYQITLPIQDYLDNIVWLHHALVKYDINMSSLKGWLEEKYSQYFSYIYQPSIEKVQLGLSNMREKAGFANEKLMLRGFDWNTYYLSWLLRGDKPSLYKSGKFEREVDFTNQWERYAINRIHMRRDDIRNIPEVVLLYHMYHYDEQVRRIGNETKTFTVPQQYVQGVIEVQKAMREEIVKRGIAIETNPSSNLNISTLSSLSEHPIKTFYNLGLTQNEKELRECPQINVSINTDNNGVFATRLENEYALLACAMEQVRSEDGQQCYKREYINQWLDNIREMGLRQTFSSE